MKSIEEIKNLISARKTFLEERFFVKEIALFGSIARGELKGSSDIDILVEFYRPISLFAFLFLEEYLEQLLDVKVDLVSKKALKPNIGKQILKEIVRL